MDETWTYYYMSETREEWKTLPESKYEKVADREDILFKRGNNGGNEGLF